ncbi:MAG TPA: hypothetical protein PKG54_19465 [Phycisphaerae bacterium]|jgi:hypothetical protein|nr:hypothetical protein [Phycisphaerae bacterium]HOB76695.1 hypothetical protein [Phycisphaerae bacterium]HOJ56394.1 hypothetical protein [Phycisphaerae bacterium]HOL26296.1 hypothetical protein [Phycisphaerae bacterium]HPP20748.1 hypothetical protein [Phycisphaerae bacterium]
MRDVRSADLKNCTFHRFGLTGGFVTANLHCTQCGEACQVVGLPMYSEDMAMAVLLQKIYRDGWRSRNGELLCPSCSGIDQPSDRREEGRSRRQTVPFAEECFSI